jgi:hypothetical protein
MNWSAITITIAVAVAASFAVVKDIDRFCHELVAKDPEVTTSSLLSQPPGCIGDWASFGVYCHWQLVDANGKQISIASRAY